MYENLYREAFPFDCAELDRKFYIPQKGDKKSGAACAHWYNGGTDVAEAEIISSSPHAPKILRQ